MNSDTGNNLNNCNALSVIINPRKGSGLKAFLYERKCIECQTCAEQTADEQILNGTYDLIESLQLPIPEYCVCLSCVQEFNKG